MNNQSKNNTFSQIIAIDGPAASGKTTIGKMLAKRLNYLFVDTGAMYRAVTLAVLQQEKDPHDEAAVVEVARSVEIDFGPAAGHTDRRLYTVLLDGQDVTWDIRSPQVDASVSAVSSYEEVRELMVEQQRQIAHDRAAVMVGRDIGTVVLPNAPLKLYMSASAEERAHRRQRDRREQGIDVPYDEVLADIKRRDKLDSEREHSPLRPASDAIIIDTTEDDPETVVTHILSLTAV